MAARNGEDEGMPIGPRPLRRDLLDNGEDVTTKTERELVIRAVNSTLETEEHIGQQLGVLVRIEGKVDGLAVRLGTIEQRLSPAGDIAQREKQTSVTAIEELVPALASELRKATLDARDGYGNLTEARATEIVERMLTNRELAGYKRGSKQREKLMWIIVGAIAAAVAAGAVGHFEGRATAPAPSPATQTK